MSFMKTNTVDIEVDGISYNSLGDFGLAIENTDYIGTPVQDTSGMVAVPGKSGLLDLMQGVFGSDAIFKSRPINIVFGGIRNAEDWDEEISVFRNLFEGKSVKLWFETEPGWYWEGKAQVQKFNHTRALGKFTFTIPSADPYKHRVRHIEVASTAAGVTVNVPNSRRIVIPTITTDASITIVANGTTTVTFAAGTAKNINLQLEAGMNSWVITGAANVEIDYIEGSL